VDVYWIDKITVLISNPTLLIQIYGWAAWISIQNLDSDRGKPKLPHFRCLKLGLTDPSRRFEKKKEDAIFLANFVQ
jgi:hypothetical protein